MQTFRRFFRNQKIRGKITLFSTVSILLLCLVFLSFYGKVASETVLSRTRETTQNNLEQIRAYMREINVTVSSRLSHLGTSISVQKVMELAQQGREDDTWSALALLRDVQLVEQIESVELYTLDGEFVEGTTGMRDENWRPSQKVLAAVRAMPDTNYWHDDESYSNSRTEELSIYRAICARPSEPIGVARVCLRITSLSDVYNYVGFSTAGDIYLFTGRGNVLLPRETSPAVLRVARDSFEDYSVGNRQEYADYAFQNTRYLIQSLPLPEYDLYVVSAASYDRLMEDVQTLQLSIALLGVVCVLVLALFFYFMSGALARPIVELSRKMQQVEAGDLTLRSDNDNLDEIGILSQSFNHMLDRIQQLMAENAASERRRHELELISLQTQITPHFLYNSLDSISALVQMGDTEGAFQMSKALGGFYRGVLSDGRSVISIDEELRMTDSYLRVQSQRYRDGFDYRIQVPQQVRQASIVKLTIQPLVENAIYHGLRKVRRRGELVIEGRVEEGEVVLSVWDNGAGMTPEQNPLAESRRRGDWILHRQGYGMYNADQRVKLCFGSRYGLRVESQPGAWTRVEVRLPLCPYEEYGHDFGVDR